MSACCFQFDDVCLVAAIAIMEKSELGDQARGNAVYVLRALSRVVGIQYCLSIVHTFSFIKSRY